MVLKDVLNPSENTKSSLIGLIHQIEDGGLASAIGLFQQGKLQFLSPDFSYAIDSGEGRISFSHHFDSTSATLDVFYEKNEIQGFWYRYEEGSLIAEKANKNWSLISTSGGDEGLYSNLRTFAYATSYSIIPKEAAGLSELRTLAWQNYFDFLAQDVRVGNCPFSGEVSDNQIILYTDYRPNLPHVNPEVLITLDRQKVQSPTREGSAQRYFLSKYSGIFDQDRSGQIRWISLI